MMNPEKYTLHLGGDELTSCLSQLNSLEERPIGKVSIQVIDGNLIIERRINKKTSAIVEIQASGHWPFPVTIKWSNFERLLLKEHAPVIKLQLFIDPTTGEGGLIADGIHLSPEEVSTQLSLELSNQPPARAQVVEKSTAKDLILERIRVLDAINQARGNVSQEQLSKFYERDYELGRLIKLIRGEACQICGHYFLTKDGGRYVECHHLEHLAHNGMDCSKNIIVVCANHHRQFHYGLVEILNHTTFSVTVKIDGVSYICNL